MENNSSTWVRFWNRGTWWKALLIVAVYWGVYELIGLGIGALVGGSIDLGSPLSDPLSAFLGLALTISLSGILLFLFARSLGWVKEIFGPQPVRGKAWMWVAVLLVVIPIFLRLMATNWSAYSIGLVLVMAFFGLCVGFTEELATRGIVVNMLRNGGYGERLVFVLSSLYFALLHSGNLLTGMAPLVVAVTVVYTFGFGAMMYLSMRATGRIVGHPAACRHRPHNVPRHRWDRRRLSHSWGGRTDITRGALQLGLYTPGAPCHLPRQGPRQPDTRHPPSPRRGLT